MIEICSRRDAAPVLFGRAASAAGAVRRLVRLNAKLCSPANNLRAREQRARQKHEERGCVPGRTGRASRTHLELIAPGLRRTRNKRAAWCDVRGGRRSTTMIVADALACGSAASGGQVASTNPGLRRFPVPVCATSTLTGEPLFRLAEAGAACRLPPMSCMQRVATCKRHDAAPVLFDRGASAPGQVRRLVRLNAKLRSRA